MSRGIVQRGVRMPGRAPQDRPVHDGSLHISLEELVQLITVVNRCWHTMKDRDADDAVTRALRDKKMALQLELIRTFGSKVELVRDDDENMALFSVRLVEPVRLRSGEVRHDAMHIPVERVEQFLIRDRPSDAEQGGAA